MRVTVHEGVRLPGVVEHVERKGLGHPDTLCDAIAERASRSYARYCLQKFGGIAHHWFDKTVLVGGESAIDWGHGEIVKPYRVIFFGKVAKCVGRSPIPLDELLLEAATAVLNRALIGFDADRHLVIENRLVDYQGAGREGYRYRPRGISDLAVLQGTPHLRSNDCNLVSAYAPLSDLEQLVLEVEEDLNSPSTRQRFPFIGSDIKLFGTKDVDRDRLTLNVPFLASRTSSSQEYFHHVDVIRKHVSSAVSPRFPLGIDISLNPQDRHGRPYLTVLGSAADTGDVGVVGRGNRSNGLITPMRPMSIEAPAGKNPTDHTGKIYARGALELANALHGDLGQNLEVHIFTAKETLVSDPDQVAVICESRSDAVDRFVQQKCQEFMSKIDAVVKSFVEPGVVLW